MGTFLFAKEYCSLSSTCRTCVKFSDRTVRFKLKILCIKYSAISPLMCAAIGKFYNKDEPFNCEIHESCVSKSSY